MRIAPVLFARFKLDGGSMFAAIPKALWSKLHPPDERDRIDLVCRGMLVDCGNRLVLVDTGIGDRFDDKWRDILAIEPVDDPWRGLDVGPSDVTDVVITHLHFDHAGGSTKLVDGRQVSAYPNAVFHIQRDHYEWFRNPSPLDRASYRADELAPIGEAGMLRLVDGEAEIAPGVRVIPTYGHAPGMQLVLVEGGRERVLYAADLIPLASQVRINYIMGYDLARILTLHEKREVLGRAADEGWWLFLEHEPGNFFFKVKRAGSGFEIAETAQTSGWLDV